MSAEFTLLSNEKPTSWNLEWNGSSSINFYTWHWFPFIQYIEAKLQTRMPAPFFLSRRLKPFIPQLLRHLSLKVGSHFWNSLAHFAYTLSLLSLKITKKVDLTGHKFAKWAELAKKDLACSLITTPVTKFPQLYVHTYDCLKASTF